MSGWYVEANDIRYWTETNKRRAEELLPLLVKKLILASVKPNSIDFPSGDNVAVGGWDGTLSVDKGSDFIPSGNSGWEIGTNSAVKKKADGDFKKRTDNSDPFDKQDTTFVFVTSRLWTKRDNWSRSKESLNKWKAVKGINAESLANWLHCCPAVHRWFAEEIGKRHPTILDIEQAWSNFRNQTEVKLTTCFFVHSRDQQSKDAISMALAEPRIVQITSASDKETYGFVLSCFQSNDIVKSRTLIIKSQESFDQMTNSESPLILIPIGFEPTGLGEAITNNHTVIMISAQSSLRRPDISLDRLPKSAREEAITQLGLTKEQAQTIFQNTKGFFEPVLRHPALKPLDYTTPKWVNQFSSDVLFAALFATEWKNDNIHDQKVLEILSGKKYSDLNQQLTEISQSADSPVRQILNTWQVISKVDFWLLISKKLSKSNLDAVDKIITKALTDTDPSFDLEPEERYLAKIKGAVPKYSSSLKQGLANSLALLAAYGDSEAKSIGNLKPSIMVNSWVTDLFQKINDTRMWYSLGSCLPYIAEAAPQTTLDAIDKASQGDNSILLGLFNAEGESWGVGGGCYHSNLLWSIELISWNKRYFSQASSTLARLSEIDPGGSWSNRPFNSLVDIYLGWINNTSVAHKERIQVIEKVLLPKYPKITWGLMTSLLLRNQKATSGINKPMYREWGDDIDRSTTNFMYYGYISDLVDLIIENCKKDIDSKLLDLIDNFDSYREKQIIYALRILDSISPGDLSEETNFLALKKLRDIISHNREFCDENWAWPKSIINRLESVYKNINFTDPVKANLYLFNEHQPDLINPIIRKDNNFEEIQELIFNERVKALREVFNIGTDRVKNLVELCDFADIVGECAYRSDMKGDLEKIAVEWLDNSGNKVLFSKGYFGAFAQESPSIYMDFYNKNTSWNDDKKTSFLLCLPISNQLVDIVNDSGSSIKNNYWNGVSYYRMLMDDVHLINIVSGNLLSANRPRAALDCIANALYGKGDRNEIDSKLISKILLKIPLQDSDSESISVQKVRHDILRCIEFLQGCNDIDKSEIINIEWSFLPFLKFDGVKPNYLMREISDEPSFFVDLVCWAFKRDDGQSDKDDGLSEFIVKQRAERAWGLLRETGLIPGQKGSDIDENTLALWVDEVRTRLQEKSRLGIGDDQVGQLLSHSPKGLDGIWPHEAIRLVLERFRSDAIETAMRVGRINSRGIVSKSPYEGGDQERRLSKQYYDDAEKLQLIYPRTSSLLFSLSRAYLDEAEYEDSRSELRL